MPLPSKKPSLRILLINGKHPRQNKIPVGCLPISLVYSSISHSTSIASDLQASTMTEIACSKSTVTHYLVLNVGSCQWKSYGELEWQWCDDRAAISCNLSCSLVQREGKREILAVSSGDRWCFGNPLHDPRSFSGNPQEGDTGRWLVYNAVLWLNTSKRVFRNPAKLKSLTILQGGMRYDAIPDAEYT